MALVPPGVNMAMAFTGGGGGDGVLWVVESRIISTPPSSPALGQQWIVGPSATGVWAGHDNEIAEWDGTQWVFHTPSEGDIAYVIDEKAYYGWNGTFWFPVSCCPTRLLATYSDGAYHAIAAIPVPDNELWMIDVKALGRRTDAPDRGAYFRRAAFYREGGGAVIREGPTDTSFNRESDGRYNVTLEPSGNNIEIRVRGVAGHTVNWSVAYTIEEVS